MMRKILFIMLILFLFIPINYASADSWTSNSSIMNGLSAQGRWGTPTVFLDGSTLKLISGEEDGSFNYWYWSGSSWVYDSVKAELGDIGDHSTPTVFLDNGTLKLISSEEYDFYGWYWSGSAWVSDSSIVSGLNAVNYRSTPTVFLDNGTLKLISGRADGGFYSYYWSGSAWVSDSSIVSGLGDIGAYSAPTVFLDNSTLKLISGNSLGRFNGWYWSGSTWISDSSIVSGLGDIGTWSAPTVFLDGDTLKMISGEKYAFYGFTPAPPTININTQVTYADTPLTEIIVNDEDNTGGSPDENGYRYLTPNTKESKEYIVYLSGNDLQNGFKLNLSASSTDVTKITIDIGNLSSSRTYNIYYDDNYIESINGVTTYEYDITSFSSHTLEVRYVASIEIRSQQNSNPLSTFINDEDSTGGFTDNNGYITLTPTISTSYPLDVQADLENGIKLTIVSTDSIPSMPITFVGLDTSNEYKLYLDGSLISTFDASSPYYYYDIITHDDLSTIEFVEVSGGGGGDGGDNDNGEEEEEDTGIIIIDDITDIEEELLVLFPEDPIRTVTTFLSQPTNWLILLGAYIGVYLGTLLTSKVNIPTVLLNGTITVLAILIIAALGLNLLLLNILFSSSSFLLAFITYTVYGTLVGLTTGD